MSSDNAQQDQHQQHDQQQQQQPSDSTLNLPAGSLPPRKRAKTEEEKEQRRVERILRNRRAAHASREKKRRHVEHLEKYVLELESCLNGLFTNQSSLLDSQSQLISLLSANNVDFSNVENLNVKPIEKIERPDYLEMTTVPDANTANKNNSNNSSSNNNNNSGKSASSSSRKSSKRQSSVSESSSIADNVATIVSSSSSTSSNNNNNNVPQQSKNLQQPEIQSPSFEDDLMSDEEETVVRSFNVKKRKISQLNGKKSSSKTISAQQSYLSPPASTSPSKFIMEDDTIMNQEYSNLFAEETEDLMTSTGTVSNQDVNFVDPVSVSTTSNQSDNTLELFKHAGASAIDSFMIFKDEDNYSSEFFPKSSQQVQVNQQIEDYSSTVDDLCAYNSVHHPAAMIHTVYQ
ncbi:unnamed protein product [Ambrosiozyma monospora]|uniref:Unnamed protein product n=1 Tax=Ambrosiozyma monospora TaxID=43982 RepID=A0A9W7DEG1_AMBMO|nr:unnamed protein product [Ambrosiozyma monospora]